MNNKKKIIFLIIIIIVLAIIGIYLAYSKGLIFKEKESIDNTSTETNTEIKEESLSLDDERFINLYNELKDYTYEQNRITYESFSQDELAKIAFNSIQFKESDFTKTNNISSLGTNYYLIKASLFQDKISEIFGANVKFDKEKAVGIGLRFLENIEPENSYMSIYSYDKDSDTYTVTFGGSGRQLLPYIEFDLRKIVSATLSNDTITVKEKVIYVDYSVDENMNIYCQIYNLNTHEANSPYIDSKTYYSGKDYGKVLSVDSYLDKAATITHVYKLNKETGKYNFVKSTIESGPTVVRE